MTRNNNKFKYFNVEPGSLRIEFYNYKVILVPSTQMIINNQRNPRKQNQNKLQLKETSVIPDTPYNYYLVTLARARDFIRRFWE